MLDYLKLLLETIRSSVFNASVPIVTIVSVLLMSAVMSLYIHFVYRVVSHRSFYNKSFNICISVMPAFLATIILCLQSNIVITLGTVGALAILRFRTAIKDPVDMLYLLWAVHIGITCGTQLYGVTILTAVFVTILLLILNHFKVGVKPMVLVVRISDLAKEKELLDCISGFTKSYRVKSRNVSGKNIDYVIELSVKDSNALFEKLHALNPDKYSLIEYDNEDII